MVTAVAMATDHADAAAAALVVHKRYLDLYVRLVNFGVCNIDRLQYWTMAF